jgi:hypothetical protein
MRSPLNSIYIDTNSESFDTLPFLVNLTLTFPPIDYVRIATASIMSLID